MLRPRAGDDAAGDRADGDGHVEDANAAVAEPERIGADDEERDRGLHQQCETQADQDVETIPALQEPTIALVSGDGLPASSDWRRTFPCCVGRCARPPRS